jgi:hypothetical protein
LLAEGHTDARNYPLAYVWSETRLVRQRIAQRVQQDAVITQTAIVSVLSKKGGQQFKNLMKTLKDDY